MYFGATPSADTLALQRLRLASRTAANARVHGTPQQAAAARTELERTAAARTAEVAQLRELEAAPGFLERLQQTLGTAGRVLAVGGAAALALLLLARRR